MITDASGGTFGLPFIMIFSEPLPEEAGEATAAQTRETRVSRETTDDD